MRKKNWIEFNNDKFKNNDMEDKVCEIQSIKLKFLKRKKEKKEKLSLLFQDLDQ